MPKEGLVARGELAAAASRWRKDARKVVFTNGCFDLLHPGHIALLADAAGLGHVCVAINSDESVRRLKGEGRPVYPEQERAEILLSLRWVDSVTVFPEDTPQETIEIVRPDVLVKGSEYGDGEIVGEDFVLSLGGEVRRFPMKTGYATSSMLRRMGGEQK